MSLIDSVFDELKIDIEPKSDDEKVALRTKIESACREIRLRRNYPEDMSDEQIEHDMNRYFSAIYHVALYDYNQRGAEGHNVLQENGEYRSWQDREKLFRGVLAYAQIV